jgi:polyisoprenoid-binding protein YceI
MTVDRLPSLSPAPVVAAARFRRRAVVLGAAATLFAPAALAQPVRYLFDQTAGTIEFTSRHMGLMHSTGRFTRFNAEIQLDSDDPSRAAVDATIETGSIVLSWPGAEDLLRSPPYFDSAHFPTAHFKGSTAGARGLEHFEINGELSLRGIARPFGMQGRLLARRFVPARGADVADFTASGTLSRSAFGMTADQIMTGDDVRIDIRVSIQLAGPTHEG